MSVARTVERMKSLLSSVSIPLEASRANHEGLMSVPLETRSVLLGFARKEKESKGFHTCSHINMNDTPSAADNPVPNIVGRMCTTSTTEDVA